MAHFIVEYSANLDGEIKIHELLAKLNAAAVATGLFPQPGLRCRAHRCEHFFVGDGNPDYAFVHLQVKLGIGRNEAEKQAASDSFCALLSEHLESIYQQRGLAISFEMTELPATLKFNRNNLRDYISAQ